jgi:hypothetical protein
MYKYKYQKFIHYFTEREPRDFFPNNFIKIKLKNFKIKNPGSLSVK